MVSALISHALPSPSLRHSPVSSQGLAAFTTFPFNISAMVLAQTSWLNFALLRVTKSAGPMVSMLCLAVGSNFVVELLAFTGYK